MAEFQAPSPCPDCGGMARRAMLTAPRLAGMNGALRAAHATNERSAHAPATTKAHPASCGCCKPGRKDVFGQASAAKSFAGKRPWMISH
jgi:hypothetical protein